MFCLMPLAADAKQCCELSLHLGCLLMLALVLVFHKFPDLFHYFTGLGPTILLVVLRSPT